MSNQIVVNGVQVYSDKQVSSIVGTRVSFSDGSYADVATGEVVNRGAGYINLGSKPEATGEKKTVTKSFEASNLEMGDLVANANIHPHDGKTVEVTITGPESLVKDIEVNQSGDTVVIRGKTANQGGMTIIQSGGGQITTRVGNIRASNIVIGGGRGVSIVGGSVISGGNIIMSGGGEPEVVVEVKVPNGANVDVQDIEGKVTVGNTDGNLRASIGGAGSVHAGRVKKINGRISGSGEVVVASVNGDAKLRISGSGSVLINDGKIGELEVSVSGSGSARVNAMADNADLDVSGVGNIYVRHVASRPSRRVSGVGNINVGNW